MKKYFLKKKIFAVIFLVFVIGFGSINFYHSYSPLDEEITGNSDLTIDELDSLITEEVLGRMNFIEMYAFAQELLGKRESNNFSMIKDENGFLHYASFFREEDEEIMEYAMRMKRLQDYANTQGTEVLFVITPSKYNSQDVTLRTGLPINDPSDIVNELMFDLNRLGVETLNLGESLPNDEVPYEEAFFKTDHHWTIPSAFYGTQKLVEKMQDTFGTEFNDPEFYMDLSNYEIETYTGGMLGSMGRKTGAVFAGVDNFTAYWPTFEGNYYRESMLNDEQLVYESGTFIESFMSPNVLTDEADLYSSSQYSLYLNELRIYEKIINNENPDGCKIFMIRDSYFSPVISFMMPMCGEIDAIWSLEEVNSLDIETYIKQNDFDYIIMQIYPYNINAEAFNFFKGE